MGRIKISKDRTAICNYIVGDQVVVSFNKYGRHTFIGLIEEISEDYHGLEGIWISILPVKEFINGCNSKIIVFFKSV